MSAKLKPGTEIGGAREPEPMADTESDSGWTDLMGLDPEGEDPKKLLLTIQRTETGATQAVITRETNGTPSQEDRNIITPLQPEIQTLGDENEPAVASAILKLFRLTSDHSNEVDRLVGRAESALKDLDVQLVTLPYDSQVAYKREAINNAKNCSKELEEKNDMLLQILQDAEEEWEEKRAEIVSLSGRLEEIEGKVYCKAEYKGLDLESKEKQELQRREREKVCKETYKQTSERKKRGRGGEEQEKQQGGSKKSKKNTKPQQRRDGRQISKTAPTLTDELVDEIFMLTELD